MSDGRVCVHGRYAADNNDNDDNINKIIRIFEHNIRQISGRLCMATRAKATTTADTGRGAFGAASQCTLFDVDDKKRQRERRKQDSVCAYFQKVLFLYV